ncbi:phage tail protein I [Pseudomonas sp. AN-1]|uniref:phage tail protein I n=1 Tax=Pseudomonas sp. AN-1 TaxID=3096605 RepID=UPI002A6A69CD|nr:phage tail protein I [Pseudomonas sp. AN-1]WPP47707.1 phage tail protein I [Pseudomonas sp. AN-1]
MSDLLPPNATHIERIAAQVGAKATDLPVILRTLWDPEECPLELLPWLAWAWSADEWSTEWTERQMRDSVKASIDVQAIKGTIGAVRTAVGALGYPVRVQEWHAQTPPGDPYTFRLLLDVDQELLTQASLQRILAVVGATKNLRSHLETALLTVTSVAAPSVAVVTGIGLDLGLTYSAPAYADGRPALDLLTDAAEHGEASTVDAIDDLHRLLHSTMTPSYW